MSADQQHINEGLVQHLCERRMVNQKEVNQIDDVVLDQNPPDKYSVLYELQCQLNVPEEDSESYCTTFNAVVDRSRSISLIESELILNNFILYQITR